MRTITAGTIGFVIGVCITGRILLKNRNIRNVVKSEIEKLADAIDSEERRRHLRVVPDPAN